MYLYRPNLERPPGDYLANRYNNYVGAGQVAAIYTLDENINEAYNVNNIKTMFYKLF